MGSIGPKNKLSRSRRDKRRAQSWKIALPNVTACNRCGELMRPHYACKACGTYNRRAVIELKEKKKK